jgi:glycosyltransferase involved in cell wall biosynthesis
VLIANPSADVYGSDLQMLESVTAMVEQGWRVVVAMPVGGTLVGLLEKRGAEVHFVDFPVLRRADSSLGGIVALARAGLGSLSRLRTEIRAVEPDAIYVNTVTLPWWILAGRLARKRVVVHVHEAETEDRRIVRFALNAPLLFANALILISKSTEKATLSAVWGLRRKSRIIYNGVNRPGPAALPKTRADGQPTRLAIVCRLSPRKAPDVALEAVAILRGEGREVTFDICGTPFAGYEWYEAQLRARAEQDDLRGSITFSGYVSPIWSALDAADIVVAPSLREPFGNAVVEAQLSARPVVASAALGHTESIIDGVSGLLVPPGDAQALAAAVARVIDGPALALSLAIRGRELAVERFSTERYNHEIVAVVRG